MCNIQSEKRIALGLALRCAQTLCAQAGLVLRTCPHASRMLPKLVEGPQTAASMIDTGRFRVTPMANPIIYHVNRFVWMSFDIDG